MHPVQWSLDIRAVATRYSMYALKARIVDVVSDAATVTLALSVIDPSIAFPVEICQIEQRSAI